MIARKVRKKSLQLETLERRELLTYLVMVDTPDASGSEAQTAVDVAVHSTHLDSFDVPPHPVTIDYTVVKTFPPDHGVDANATDPYLTNATRGVDYMLDDGALTFQPGESEKTLTIHVVDDHLLEPFEVIRVVLTSQDDDVNITEPDFEYVMEDDDSTSRALVASPGQIENYLGQEAFWQPKDLDMSQDSGSVWAFTNKVIGRSGDGGANFQGYLIPVQGGVRGQAAPFTWTIHDKLLAVSGQTAKATAVGIEMDGQAIDLYDLLMSKNAEDELLEWKFLPGSSSDYSSQKLGYFYKLDSAQVAAAIRGQFQLGLAPIQDATVNAAGELKLVAQPTGGAAADPHTFSLDPGAPAGATIDPNTGAFSWAVPENQPPGKYPVTIRVTDNVTSLSASSHFTIAVNGSGIGPETHDDPKTKPNVKDPVVTVTGAAVVRAKKGTSQIVLSFNGPLAGGAGLPVGAFQLTTIPKGKKARPKPILLASAIYNADAHTVTLTPRGKLNFKTPLKLTVNGLSGEPATLILTKHGASPAARSVGQAVVSSVAAATTGRPASVLAAGVDALFLDSLDDPGVPTSRRHHQPVA